MAVIVLSPAQINGDPYQSFRQLTSAVEDLEPVEVILYDPGPKHYHALNEKIKRSSVGGNLELVFDMFRYALVVGHLATFQRIHDVIVNRVMQSGYFTGLTTEERTLADGRIVPEDYNEIGFGKAATPDLKWYIEQYYLEFGRNYHMKTGSLFDKMRSSDKCQAAFPNARVEIRLITSGLFVFTTAGSFGIPADDYHIRREKTFLISPSSTVLNPKGLF